MDDEDAAVEKQKLVADDEADNEPDDEQNISSSAPKTIQTPISPVLSNKVYTHFVWWVVESVIHIVKWSICRYFLAERQAKHKTLVIAQ